VPVTLRYDPEPPQLGFDASSTTDPTLVSVPVTDAVSGLAGGTIEMSPIGSGTWQALPTQKDGSRLLARIDDAALPSGAYQLRARAVDQAGNEASTDRRLDGQLMSLTLPLRIESRMRAGFLRIRTVHRRGGRKVVRRRVTVLKRTARVVSGGHARIVGRLVNRDGLGIPGAEVRVMSASATSLEQLVAALQTDGNGRFRYRAAGSTSRTLRFVYAGAPLVLPADRAIEMIVPARTSLRVNRSRVLNGQAVEFSGSLRTQPAPAGGKLVELQARLTNRWQTFRTTRTDAAGRWAIPYRFKRTRGVQRFRFRARLPREGSYPFADGGSRIVVVRVKGR
jgi:5-hydroxyisourate hydrolase-like protein (transthyretin family)